jgi:APA family basic amino acid/polyamine antiporter
VRITLFTALIVGVLAGLVPLEDLAALANAGTLTAFTFVALCMLVMRRRAPDAERRFRAPLPWLIGAVAIFGCAYLFYSLPQRTQLYFLVAHLVGFGIYVLYSSPRAERARSAASA